MGTCASIGVVAALLLIAPHGMAFSQKSPATPMGHEYLTAVATTNTRFSFRHQQCGSAAASKCRTDFVAQRLAALHPAFDPLKKPIPESSRSSAKHYGAASFAAYSAVIGQRWVDLMGFPVGFWEVRDDATACWDAIVQANDAIQYDHFLRRSTDIGDTGRVRAMEGAAARFRRYFIEAVRARDGEINVRDGGLKTGIVTVSRPFFMLGFAIHLLQDSFSAEHAVRSSDFAKVRDIKSYICHPDAPGHTHSNPLPTAAASHGDIIVSSRDDALSITPSNKALVLRDSASAAMAATYHTFLAFVRARANASTPEAAADQLIKMWLQVDETYKTDPKALPSASEVKSCLGDHESILAKARKTQSDRVKCATGLNFADDPNASMEGPRHASGHRNVLTPPFAWTPPFSFPSMD
jgi:hypothetical protein